MAPRSSIELDPRLKDAADDAIRRGATVDEILEALQGLGAEVSRSAVGRYAFKVRSTMARLRETREVAKVWADKFGSEPDGDVGQLVGQVLHAVAFQQASKMADANPEETEGPGPREVMFLAGALKDIASAQKINADRIVKIRQEMAKQAAKTVDQVIKARGLTKEAVEEIKAKILGVAG